MLDDYPEARKFYMERAWQRRIEFRRRQRKFLRNLVLEEFKLQNGEMSSRHEEKPSDHECSSVVEEDSMYSDESDRETDQKLKDRLDKKCSKFYYNVEIQDELEKIASDDETDALEEISEDEYQDNIKELLEEDNK